MTTITLMTLFAIGLGLSTVLMVMFRMVTERGAGHELKDRHDA